MPLLFVLAGISSRYALTRRKPIEYFKERLNKLFIPLLSGILLIIPGMTYFADRFHNDYTGNYFQHYVVFFTKWTDLTGYDGGFSPGHLWFILYLLVISIIAFPLIMIYNKIGKKYNWGKINFCILGSFFIFPCIGQLILDINGKSVGEYFFWYIIGYFILSEDIIITKCKKYYLFLSIISIIGMIFILIIFNINLSVNGIIYDIVEKLYAYISILALLGISKRKFDFSNKITDYFSKSSFAVYLFHLIWITIIAFYTVKVIKNIMIQVFVILLFSIILTFITYELLKRFKVTRIMFCLKK
jgi:peptidoglycan/LPS O-acetylase OafA/YrhL